MQDGPGYLRESHSPSTCSRAEQPSFAFKIFCYDLFYAASIIAASGLSFVQDLFKLILVYNWYSLCLTEVYSCLSRLKKVY